MRKLLRNGGIVILALMALTFVSCGKTSAKKNVTKVQVMVGFGTGTDPSQIAVHEQIQKEFNQTVGKEKGIELEFLTVQYSDASTKFTTLVAGGMTPDICGPVGVMGVANFIDEWMDIEPFITRDNFDLSGYDQALIDTNRYNIMGEKKLVGLPIGFYPSAVYYNEDIFDRHGIEYPPSEWGTPDWTYEKLYEIAKVMTVDEKGRTPADAGYDMKNVAQYGYDGGDWSPWRAFVGKFFDDNGNSVCLGVTPDYKTATMNSKEWKAAFKELERQIFVDKIRPQEGGSTLFGDNDPLGSNKLAMWEVFSWMSYAYEGWDANFNWNIGAVPSMKGHIVAPVNADTFVMCKSAKNHDAAWEVYKWLFSSEIYSKLCKNYGGIPALKDLQDNWVKDQREGVKDEDGEYLWNQYPRPEKNWEVLLGAGAYADNPNNESWVPNFQKVWDAMEQAMANVIAHIYDTTDQLAEELNDEVQGYLDEFWAAQK